MRSMKTLKSSTPTALLTGFGPFPGVAHNATGVLVPRLAAAARRQFPEWSIATAILPTEWSAAPVELARHLARARPVLALHFGVSREARGFVIETLGRNLCRDTADAAGINPTSALLDADGPAARAASLPTPEILARLARSGLPAATSDDAGGYLCNAVLYHSLGHAALAARSARAGFIHIPVDLGQPGSGLSLPDAVRGGLDILAACLAGLAQPGPALASGR